MFRRRRKDAEEAELDSADDIADSTADSTGDSTADSTGDDGEDAVGIADGAPMAGPSGRSGGPWDIEAVPDDDLHRLDLGGLQIPVVDGVEVRVDVEQDSGQVVSATLATAQSMLQVLAFAAPRSAGIWPEIRVEILGSITGSGGRAETVEGAWGTEIVADIPTDIPGELAPARFIGVDGPRWFLRGLVQGAAANAPSSEPALFHAFSQVVVVRGDEAMAVRDQIPLRLPREALHPDAAPNEPGAAAGSTSEREPGQARFDPPERGPEITEIG